MLAFTCCEKLGLGGIAGERGDMRGGWLGDRDGLGLGRGGGEFGSSTSGTGGSCLGLPLLLLLPTLLLLITEVEREKLKVPLLLYIADVEPAKSCFTIGAMVTRLLGN